MLIGLSLTGLTVANRAYAETRASAQHTLTGTYPTVLVNPGQWRAQYRALGRVRAQSEFTLYAPARLRVQQVMVEQGQTVRPGQPLARVSVPALPDVLDRWVQARDAVTLSVRVLANTRQRMQARLATQVDVLHAELQWRGALAQRSAAWRALARVLGGLGQTADKAQVTAQLHRQSTTAWLAAHSVVAAPFGGQIMWRAAPGVSLLRNARLFQLAQLHHLYIDIQVAPAQTALWREASVRFRPGLTGAHVVLRRAAQAPIYDAQTGMAVWRFATASPVTGSQASGSQMTGPDEMTSPPLLDGQWGQATAMLPARPVLWVPASAVVERQGQTYCILADAQGYHAVPVTVGEMPAVQARPESDSAADAGPPRLPVLAGLKPGQRVVTRGAYELLYRDLNSLMQPSD